MESYKEGHQPYYEIIQRARKDNENIRTKQIHGFSIPNSITRACTSNQANEINEYENRNSRQRTQKNPPVAGGWRMREPLRGRRWRAMKSMHMNGYEPPSTEKRHFIELPVPRAASPESPLPSLSSSSLPSTIFLQKAL